MIRKLILPALAALLLGGCVTAGYGHRPGYGGAYYGAPAIEYRYSYGYPYGGAAYGYYGYSPYDYGYAYPYGYGYGYGQYGYPYYGYPYYGYPYGSQYYYRPATRPHVDPTPDRTRSPWRDLERVRRQSVGEPDGPQPARRKIALPPVRSQSRVVPARSESWTVPVRSEPRVAPARAESWGVPVRSESRLAPARIESSVAPAPRSSGGSGLGGRVRAAKERDAGEAATP